MRNRAATQTPNLFRTLGGRVQCVQCQATSKRTGYQCRAPAIKGKRVCRFHGGYSTGPKTEEGRQRCAAAKTTHGRVTSEKRLRRSEASRRLHALESICFARGLLRGNRTPGRKPRAAIDSPESNDGSPMNSTDRSSYK